MILIPAVAQFFKYKVVSSIIVFTCNWASIDRMKLVRELSQYGLSATFSCDPAVLSDVHQHRFQGVLYIKQNDDSLLEKVKLEHFSMWYKWLVIGDGVPDTFHKARYDADVTLVKLPQALADVAVQSVGFYDVYIHRKAYMHPWAFWTDNSGFQLVHENERILRRKDVKKYPLKIAAPVAHYSTDWYDGTFTEYLTDDAISEHDAIIRCSYAVSSLILENLNGTEELVGTETWSAIGHNSSMLEEVSSDSAQLAGAILRILPARIVKLDFILPFWPFSVGFTYLAERESSSNMYVEPFSAGVWWSCLAIGFVLAIAQRITARNPDAKEGAYIGVLATWLQQDASAVPENVSGRWSFIVLSVCSMLVHAYYTSAIVSALMSSGRSGPDSLKALGDSRYSIASEDYDYMRYLFFDVKTNWEELEYLKKKKLTLDMYQNVELGVELVRSGSTAYHTEYNQLYPHLKTFSDDQLCKLQYVDTIPEILTWVTSAKRSEWTDVFRSSGAWLLETGLVNRLVTRYKARPPPCRSSLLAERVKFGDVAPLLGLTALGGVMSCIVLGLEVMIAKLKMKKIKSDVSEETVVSDVSFE